MTLPNDHFTGFSESNGRKPTLLIVDDEDGVCQSMRLLFKDDFNLLTAGDGATAIELAQHQQIDVAVLDIRMAYMTGIEVLERLKMVDPSIEAVMMTAYETPETMRQALRLQACDYINKPFEIATMRAAVAAALGRRNRNSAVHDSSSKVRQLQSQLDEQKMEGELVRTRGEILASIIHDINGPLTIISGLLQFVTQRVGDEKIIEGEDLELVRDRLKRINRQVTNCVEISRRYLGLLRQPPQEHVRVWINQLLSDLGDLARAHPHARNHELIIHPLPEDVAVPVHATDLIQLLLNLTINALQCSPTPHRVELTGHLLPVPLDTKHLQDGPEDLVINRESFNNQAPLIALSVQDNGPGIDPDILPRIFEPYFTTHAKRTGTGLGLCIVQRLVKLVQGLVHVHSKRGQGTVVTVYLPAGTAD